MVRRAVQHRAERPRVCTSASMPEGCHLGRGISQLTSSGHERWASRLAHAYFGSAMACRARAGRHRNTVRDKRASAKERNVTNATH